MAGRQKKREDIIRDISQYNRDVVSFLNTQIEEIQKSDAIYIQSIRSMKGAESLGMEASRRIEQRLYPLAPLPVEKLQAGLAEHDKKGPDKGSAGAAPAP